MPFVTGEREHPDTYLADAVVVARIATDDIKRFRPRAVDEWVPTLVEQAADACRETHFVRTSEQSDENRLTRALYLRHALENLVVYAAVAIRELDAEMGPAMDAHERVRNTCGEAAPTSFGEGVTCELRLGHDGDWHRAGGGVSGGGGVWVQEAYDEEAEAEAELMAAAERIAKVIGMGVTTEAVEVALRSAWDGEPEPDD